MKNAYQFAEETVNNAESFLDPEALVTPEEANKPYPVDALPPVMRNAVQTYRSFGQQPMQLVACSALASASLATQGLVDVARDKNLIGPVSLNIAVIAESGERKTSADGVMARAIRRWAKDYLEAHSEEMAAAKAALAAYQAEREGLLAKIKTASGGKAKKEDFDIETLKVMLKQLEQNAPAPPIELILFYEDCTPEGLAQKMAVNWPSASVWSDEAGLIVGGHGMGDDSMMRYLGLFNRMWDGKEFGRQRSTTKSFTVRGRRLTCSLMMQHVVLSRLMGAGGGMSRGMGFLARYLLAWPVTTMGLRPYREADLYGPEMTAWDNKLTELLSLPLPVEDANMTLKPSVLALSPAAKWEWIAFHDTVEKELCGLGEYSEVNDFAAKCADNAVRLAAIFWTLQHGPEGEINLESMQAGAALASWHLNEARRIFGMTNTPQAILTRYCWKNG